MPNLDDMINGWTSHFWSADHEIEWVASEADGHVQLAPNTVLIGRVDAFGRDSRGELFFGEWKTSSPRDKKTWKQTWRMNAQSLSYGLLAQKLYPGCNRFTVRKAFKENVPTFDHAWYSYSDAELEHWKHELIGVANEIRGYMQDGAIPWPTNFKQCFRYGTNYACPHFENGCSKLKFEAVPEGATVQVSELREQARLNGAPDLVILSPSGVEQWYECREQYRKSYVDNLKMPPSEALELGANFHEILGKYYAGMVQK